MENAASRFGQRLAHTGTYTCAAIATAAAPYVTHTRRSLSPYVLLCDAQTEKKYRDLALKKLSVYLTKKTEWTDLEWDKLWKALFYCMWMSDKRPIQEELSSNLASLVHTLPSVELALGFVHSFFRTMHREWHGIDGLRCVPVSKYGLLFVTCVLVFCVVSCVRKCDLLTCLLVC